MEKKLSDEEIIAKLYVTNYNYVMDSFNNSIKLYEAKSKFEYEMLSIEKENEPLKIFKRKHIEWENRIKELEIKYDKTLNILMEEYEGLGDLLKD